MTSPLPIVHISAFPFWALRDRLKERALTVMESERPSSKVAAEDVAAHLAQIEHADALSFALKTLASWREEAKRKVTKLKSDLQGFELQLPLHRELLLHVQDMASVIEAAPVCVGEVADAELARWRAWHNAQSRAFDLDADLTPLYRGWLSGCVLEINYETNEISCCFTWSSGDLPDELVVVHPMIPMDDAAVAHPLNEHLASPPE